MSEARYDRAFYERHKTGSGSSAEVVAPMVVEWLRPKSVVDVGCGMGTWAGAFLRRGVEDVIGVDGYNKFRSSDAGGPDSNQPWTSFGDIFQPIYDAYPQKPFMVAETASAEDPSTPGRKAAWIDDAHATIAARMPRLKAFVWFLKGPVNGDLISRRGQLEGTEIQGSTQMIRASVPLSDMFGYATELRSRTQGRGSFTMHFSRYEEVPKAISEEIVARVQGKVTK